MLFAPSLLDPRDSTADAFAATCSAHGLAEREARRLMAAVFVHGLFTPQGWAEKTIISKALERALEPLPRLQLESRRRAASDGFEKLLFRTADGLPLETVIIPLHRSNAASICLSSQVGCVMGCSFCATARMTRRRNLQTWEIIDQFLQARSLLSERRITGAVFMGMGEPFLNYERVMAAAEILRHPVGGQVSGKAITVSTVGLVPEIDRFTNENRRFRLSISLGAPTDAQRAKLVPIAARTPVHNVMAAARRHAFARHTRVNLAYVCIRGENVSDADARALAELIGDTPVRLDLIDVNDATGRYSPPEESELRAFRGALAQHLRQPVVRRYSGGAEISAACGTLAGAG